MASVALYTRQTDTASQIVFALDINSETVDSLDWLFLGLCVQIY